jgi:hypothetical protein
MDLTHMLAALRAERQQIEEPILVLQRLAATSGGKRRGRLPKWMASEEASIPTLPTRKRKPFSAATRKRMAAAQRKRWAAARKAGARIVGSVSLARSRWTGIRKSGVNKIFGKGISYLRFRGEMLYFFATLFK